MSRGTPTMTIDQLRRVATPRLERDAQREVLVFLNSLPGVEAFPYKPGMFRVTDRKGKERRVRTGKKGVADVLAFATVEVGPGTPPMPLGRGVVVPAQRRRLALFMVFEVKRERGAKPTPEQAAFLDRALKAGALGGVVHDAVDVRRILGDAGWRDGRPPVVL